MILVQLQRTAIFIPLLDGLLTLSLGVNPFRPVAFSVGLCLRGTSEKTQRTNTERSNISCWAVSTYRVAGSEIKICGQMKSRPRSTQPTPHLPCMSISRKLLASVLHDGAVSLGSCNNTQKVRRKGEESADLGKKLRPDEVGVAVMVVVSAGVPGKQECGLVVGLWA